MKKLGKLSINPEKVIKNEELVNLRGGYDEGGDPGGTYGFGSCGFDGGSLGPDGAMCGHSKASVLLWVQTYGGHWCCDTPTDYCGVCG